MLQLYLTGTNEKFFVRGLHVDDRMLNSRMVSVIGETRIAEAGDSGFISLARVLVPDFRYHVSGFRYNVSSFHVSGLRYLSSFRVLVFGFYILKTLELIP